MKARHRQRQLHIVITAFIPIGEIMQVKWDVSHLQVAATAQFMRYVLGNVFRLAFNSIEGDDADWVAVRPGES